MPAGQECSSHLKEAAVGIKDGRQITADVGIHRGLNEDVLEANFDTRRLDSHTAQPATSSGIQVAETVPVSCAVLTAPCAL